MSAQDPTPLPPTTVLSSKPISQSIAHDFLAAYLDRATTDPALQPNAGISEHGPVSRTTAAAPNIILHNLKRVQAGLTGEVLGRDLAIAEMKEGAQAQAQTQDGNDEGSWEDKKQFEREQEIEGNGVNVGGEEAMDVDDTEAAVEGNAAGTLDKEERKKLKKERRKAEKKAKLKETEE
ncbi:hypothetical protein ASPSYDRAFT_62370 [Aspergillus sydowii CBS 593.65]|uniref:Uncharacterized protein n=1 Tax=Aspergillus sydowii CBS 593.65 TaxID=1036612 RepID=A0A1L9T1C1_9EURO|nr:uncharacterized protein ASPSYDRAFT_62370 [Aspergillus sydowii CBS 593.65]OJJ53209.1 hypothetical protein ASPSYDRAFT_62370 [Aspergillus sydowii CBS 593.65]